MERIVFLDRATMGDDLELATPAFAHEFDAYPQTTSDQVAERLRGARYAITNKVPITRAMLSELPELRMSSVAATGYDQIDLAACAEHGVAVTNVRGYAGTSVPEHALALMLALARGLVAYREQVREGAWERAGQFCFFDAPIRELSGATLGIVGSGNLGTGVAQRARALGMECRFAARKGAKQVQDGYTPFGEVLEQADVLSLHCPLTPDTRGLIGEPEFARMTRAPILVNCARGVVVDEEALCAALDEGRGRRHRLRRRRTAAGGQPNPSHQGPAERHRHAPRSLGQPRGSAGALAPADRRHRGLPCRPRNTRSRSRMSQARARRPDTLR